MASQRNRLLEIISYLESLGIKVNCGKNKARGNKGFFRVNGNNFRIDIAEKLSEEEILKVLVHEFAHFVHYRYDKSLQSLSFIIKTREDEQFLEELIQLTVHTIPKKSIAPLFEIKEQLQAELKEVKSSSIPNIYQLESKQKALRRINSRINRLNKYYNSPTELFARSMELYVTDRSLFVNKAPMLLQDYDEAISQNKIPELANFIKILL